MNPRQKLYVVTHKDLPLGAQAVQSGHAIIGYSFQDAQLFKRWHSKSDYLCYLVVDDEEALESLCDEAVSRGIGFYAFYEPDFDDALTAVCFDPILRTTKLVSGLSLALRE